MIEEEQDGSYESSNIGRSDSALESSFPEFDGKTGEPVHLDPTDDGLGAVAASVHTNFEGTEYIDGIPQVYDPSLQRVIVPEGATKADVVAVATKMIPNNEYGMISFFYRSDLLPYNLGVLTQGDIDNCTVELDYSEGYPVFNGGHIFWEQLPHEPYLDFTLFQRYLQQAEELGLRQLQMLSMEEKVNLARISSLAKEYFWNARARAFDYFAVAAETKKRILRARKTEGSHFDLAATLLEKLKEKFLDPKWIDGLTTKEAIDALTDLIKIQRISLGLTPNGTGAGSNNPADGKSAVSGESLLRELTKTNVESDGIGLNDSLMELLKDPNFTIETQRLIFKVRGTNGLDTTGDHDRHMRHIGASSTAS